MGFFVKLLKGLRTYFRDAWNEMKRITWPSKKDLWASFLTVMLVIAVIGAFLGAIDLVLTSVIGYYLR
ncbi:MAG TPA: preprotein translocase subunit SecE [Atribacteraceae bacterium]|nr:preprotein translocase subunit SecE [Atribacteraceae bacterium]